MNAPKQTRRGILAGLSASVASPAMADDGVEFVELETESDAPSLLPDHRVDAAFMMLPNPVRNEFELFFVSGPREGNGNIMCQIRLKPDQARRIALQILAEMEGWKEQVDKAQAAFGKTFD